MHGYYDPQALTEARAVSLIKILSGKKNRPVTDNNNTETRRFKGARHGKKL
jgi:hypothetical protein